MKDFALGMYSDWSLGVILMRVRCYLKRQKRLMPDHTSFLWLAVSYLFVLRHNLMSLRLVSDSSTAEDDLEFLLLQPLPSRARIIGMYHHTHP